MREPQSSVTPTPRRAAGAPPRALERSLAERYERHCRARLALDLTRGKPGPEQVALASALDGILGGDFRAEDGTDVRNYGAPEGIPEARRLGGAILGLPAENVLAGENGSLPLMYHYALFAHRYGPGGHPDQAWQRASPARFVCPVPGYDRHFTICEELGIEMVPVAMRPDGPDMTAVEHLVETDPRVRGMWCVPRYSNPGGEVYADAVIERIAALGARAAPGFRVLWDNAYAVHDWSPGPEGPPVQRNVMEAARAAGTADSVVLFGSLSKVTLAGAGIAFLGATRANLDGYLRHAGAASIGPDKVNQLRHVRFLRDLPGVKAHMARHAELVGPKFALVERMLHEGLGATGDARWTTPAGGYFVSLHTRPGLALEVVRLAAAAGVKLTPAGAAFPYGRDPEDSHIRIAPTFPSLAELERAMEVLVTCVRLAAVRQGLGLLGSRA